MEVQQSSLLDLEIDEVAVPLLQGTTKWTKFLAILFFVFLALILLVGLAASTLVEQLFNKYSGTSYAGTFTGGIILLMILIVVAVGGVVSYLLYSFSIQAKKGVDLSDQLALEKGIGSLRAYFQVLGILGIIGLVFTLIGLLV